MRLVSPDLVLEALGIAAQAGSLQVAGAALDAVTEKLAGSLEVRFNEATAVDYYDVFANTAKGGSTFRLTYGYVSEVVVRATPDNVLPADEANGVIVPPTDYVVHAVDGTVTMMRRPPYGYRALGVTYNVGWAVKSATKLPVDLPEWMRQAALRMAVYLMQTNPTTIAKDKTRFMADIGLGSAANVYRALVCNHLRPRAGMALPDYNEVQDA